MLRKSISFIIILCLSIFLPLCVTAGNIEVEPNAQQVRIPLTVDLSNVIAGAQIAFSHTDGLSFVEYEQSEAVKAGLLTPVVEKNDAINLGFFSGENIFAPHNGKLDMGYLIFDYVGQTDESVTVAGIELVWVIDKNNTQSEFFDPFTITVSRENSTVGISDENPPAESLPPLSSIPTGSNGNSPANTADHDNAFNVWWIIAALVLVAVIILIIVLIRNNKNARQHSDTPGGNQS